MQDMYDLAKKLHEYTEAVRKRGKPPGIEFELLSRATLQTMREMADLERRMRRVEGVPPEERAG